MAERITAVARVRVLVEVQVRGAWGEDCTVGQVHAQALEGAKDRIRSGLEHGVRAIEMVATDMIVTCEGSK